MAKNNNRNKGKGCNSANKGGSNSNSNSRGRSASYKRGNKSVEIDVDRKDINYADLGVKGMRNNKDNDPSWYMHNPALVRDSANVGYSWPLGIKLSLPQNIVNIPTSNTTSLNPAVVLACDSIPGVCVAEWTPTIGLSENYTSPINVAMQKLYAYTSYDISRTLSYNAPDLMNMILGMDSAYSYYAMLVRLYGVMQLYSSTNRYLPIALVKAMHVDFEDIQTHLSEFRYFINQYAYKLSSINVPSEMDYITRHVWMNTNIYTDGPNAEAQLYMFVQRGFYQYVEVTEGPAYLEYIDLFETGGNLNYEQLVTFGNQLLLSILGSEDIGIISGDILKTFGSGALFTLAPIAETYLTVPTYSREVLSQFENLTVHGPIVKSIPARNISANITQVVTGLTGGPALSQKLWFSTNNWLIDSTNTSVTDNVNVLAASIKAASSSKLLNMHIDEPSPEDNMVATRLAGIIGQASYDDDNGLMYSFIQTGTEVVNALVIYYNDHRRNNLPEGFTINTPLLIKVDQNTLNPNGNTPPKSLATGGLSAAVSLLSQFDWHPNLPIIEAPQTGTVYPEYFPFMDTDNYAILSATDLTRLHETALLSEFAVKKAWEISSPKLRESK